MKKVDGISNPAAKPAPHDPDLKLAPKINPAQMPVRPTSAGQPPKAGKKALRWILSLIFAAILGLGGIVLWRAGNLSARVFVGSKTTFYQQVKEFIRGSLGANRLLGEDLGQINILLLGIGGEGHDGPYLTDTIILSQIRPDSQSLSLVSIPRDYLADLPGLGYRKINNAFAEGYARKKNFDEGGAWARQAAEKISGLQIPYFAVVDFAGFEQAVDLIGGLDIVIERTFTDYAYPNGTNGYLPPITFKAGEEHINGERALQFVRSRHAAGPEGSDFARSLRQQKILEAFKQKILNLNLIADAGKINRLLDIFASHFHTNVSPSEIYRLYALEKKINKTGIVSLSLDPETGLVCPEILPENGAYVLTPCSGKTPQDIENFFKNSFVLGQLADEKTTIWLANSTHDPAVMKRAQTKLKDARLNFYEVPFSESPLSQSVLYQVNSKPATAEFLKNQLPATIVTLPPPGFKLDTGKADIIVILGGTSEKQSDSKK